MISASPVLQDHDLIRLLVESTLDHQIAIARRGRLSSPVIEAILKQEEPAVLTALAGNDTADISRSAMENIGARLTNAIDFTDTPRGPVRHVVYEINRASFASGPLINSPSR